MFVRRMGTHVPKLRISVPSLRMSIPSLGIDIPNLGIDIPNFGTHIRKPGFTFLLPRTHGPLQESLVHLLAHAPHRICAGTAGILVTVIVRVHQVRMDMEYGRGIVVRSRRGVVSSTPIHHEATAVTRSPATEGEE